MVDAGTRRYFDFPTKIPGPEAAASGRRVECEVARGSTRAFQRIVRRALMNTVARRVRQRASHARPGFPIAVAPLLAALAILVALPIIFVVLQAVFPHFALGA